MQPSMVLRRVAAFLVLSWAALTVAATCLQVLGAPAVPPAPKPFNHSQHVNDAWLAQPEVFRDCRGCHRFGPTAPNSAPQALCNDCHAGAGKLTPPADEKWQRDLSAYATRTGPAFRHHTHGMLECAQCHDAQGFVLDHFPIESGPGQCARCHDASVTADVVDKFRWFGGVAAGEALDEALRQAIGLPEPFSRPSDLTAYATRLKQVFGGEDGGINRTPLPVGGDFDHADHIPLRAGAPGIECAVCHDNVRKASASEVGTGSMTVDGCKDCHIRAVGQPARAAEGKLEVERPLWSLGTFAHADHFAFLEPGGKVRDGVASAASHDRIRDDGCATCHTYAPAVPGLSERDFPFDGSSSRHRYADCIACHDQAGWQTGESLPGKPAGDLPPLHGSNAGEGWQSCSACHVLGEPDLAKRRPEAEVQRWTERTFVFAGQTHPDITTLGVQKSRDAARPIAQRECAECHRAVVPSLPSRLIERTFRHATHLTSAPTQAECVACHPRAQQATTSGDLAADDFRTYTLEACAKCHWGDPVVEKVAPGDLATRRQVVAFPHGPHVAAGAQCADCHVPDAGGRDMTTRPEAAGCTACHDHQGEPGGKRPAEFLLADEVASCVRCHKEGAGAAAVASVPPPRGSSRTASDPRYHSTQSAFAGFRDSQFHPADSNCSECHRAAVRNGLFATVSVPTGDHLMVEHAQSVHANVDVGGFGRVKPEDCLRCHWKTVNGYAADIRLLQPSELRELRRNPGSAATRARFGNAFDGYPGKERAGG